MITTNNEILLHACCGPCLTSSKERLDKESILSLIFWYNPNIEPEEEHNRRLHTLYDYLDKSGSGSQIIFEYNYETENQLWRDFIKGLENEPEGGNRCKKCIEFRLQKTAPKAEELGIDFTTTLTVSPHKNSKEIIETGLRLAQDIGVNFLNIDFKKNDGYKRSIELSKEFGLYRQNYCGCKCSK